MGFKCCAKGLLFCLATAPAWSAEPVPDAEFWEWYGRYVNEDGEVFDPLDLQDMSELAEKDRAAAQGTDTDSKRKPNQETRQQESTDETQGSNKP